MKNVNSLLATDVHDVLPSPETKRENRPAVEINTLAARLQQR
jgi:hypothetical protein